MNVITTAPPAAMLQEQAARATQQEASEFQRLLQQDFQPRSIMTDGPLFERMLRTAELMADGGVTVPAHLRGKVGDCMAIVTQAMAWNMNPYLVAQKTHVVNGALGYEAQLVMAVINTSPLLATRLDFEWSDNDWSNVKKDNTSVTHWCIASARLRGEREPRRLVVSMAQVGPVRNSPLWAADPRQQLAYLAAKRWARLYASDVVLGVYTPDELEEAGAEDKAPPASTPPAPRRKSAAQQDQPRVDLSPEPAQNAEATQPPADGQAPASGPAQAPAAEAVADGEVINQGQAAYLTNKAKQAGVDEGTLCGRLGIDSLAMLPASRFDAVRAELLAMC